MSRCRYRRRLHHRLWVGLSLGLLSALAATPAPLRADKPLREAAKDIAAKDLKAGCIVTGECINNQVTYALAGTRPSELGETSASDLLFEIGSITKTFTSLLLAQAVVEGKVKLDSTVGELLGPNHKFVDPRIARIKLQQLSTHTSGLPRLPDNLAAVASKEDPYARYDAKMMLAFLASAKLEGSTPFPASYSNYGAGLLGHLLAGVYGKPWETLIVERICQPLGLTNTRVDIARLKLPMAPPYAGDKTAHHWNFDALAGAGALRSTAGDLMKYGEAILHPEKTPLREAFALALKPRADFPALGGQIGLGIFMSMVDGNLTYGHGGGTGGYRSSLQVIPAKGIVRVVLINDRTCESEAVLAAVRETPQLPKEKPAEIKLAADVLAPYAGVYELGKDASFTVLLDAENQLWARLTGQTFLRIFPRSPSRFFYKVVDAEIEFYRTGDKVTSLTLFQNGRELKASRTAAPPPKIRLRAPYELKPYTGTYSLLGGQDLKVTVRGNTLFAEITGQPPAPVFETAPDVFEYDVVKARLVFTRSPDTQAINGLTLHQNGMLMPAPKLASKPKK